MSPSALLSKSPKCLGKILIYGLLGSNTLLLIALESEELHGSEKSPHLTAMAPGHALLQFTFATPAPTKNGHAPSLLRKNVFLVLDFGPRRCQWCPEVKVHT